jgi:hypothetical protein
MARYHYIRDNLQTGDIVLFDGRGFISRLIQIGSGSRWSHVGMIIRTRDLDLVLVWESTGLSKSRDVRDGTVKKGVQLVTLSSRIETVKGSIAVRHYDGIFTDEQLEVFAEFRKDMRDLPYERNLLELILSLFDFSWLRPNKPSLSSVFCSELVAEALKRLDMMTDEHPSNEFVPADFGDNGLFEQYLINGHNYLPEVFIK